MIILLSTIRLVFYLELILHHTHSYYAWTSDQSHEFFVRLVLVGFGRGVRGMDELIEGWYWRCWDVEL